MPWSGAMMMATVTSGWGRCGFFKRNAPYLDKVLQKQCEGRAERTHPGLQPEATAWSLARARCRRLRRRWCYYGFRVIILARRAFDGNGVGTGKVRDEEVAAVERGV